MNRNKCPSCDSLTTIDKYIIKVYSIKECTKCKTLFVENVPTKKQISDLYSIDDYYSLPVDAEQRIIKENSRRVKQLKRLMPSGKALDIGCARGLFLNEIKKNNYDTYGIELSKKNTELCRLNGHKVFNGDLDTYYHEKETKFKFDIITCLDVIEHIPQPQNFLIKILDLLDDDGILVISTPNFSGIISKILGRKDPFLIPPEHLNFFSKKGMGELFNLTDLKIIEMITFGYITEDGLERTLIKYFPNIISPISFIVKPTIDLSVRSLNLFRNGLELEYYLKKR